MKGFSTTTGSVAPASIGGLQGTTWGCMILYGGDCRFHYVSNDQMLKIRPTLYALTRYPGSKQPRHNSIYPSIVSTPKKFGNFLYDQYSLHSLNHN